MDYFCGLDIAIDTTAMCVVDDQGVVVLEASMDTDPVIIAKRLKPYLSKLKRVGHEAGSLSPWLHPELLALGLPAVCLESTMSAPPSRLSATKQTRPMRSVWPISCARAGTNPPTSRAIGYRLRLILTQRRNLKRKFLDIENTIRHSLKAFGIRLGGTSRGRFGAAVREAVKDDALTTELMELMLTARAVLWTEYSKLHKLVVRFVARHEVCRRFMEIPGVGPVAALTFMTSIDDPTVSGGRATLPPTSA